MSILKKNVNSFNMKNALNDIFDDLFNSSSLYYDKKNNINLELKEDNSNYFILADVPGVNQKDIDIRLIKNNSLCIKAKKIKEYKNDKQNIIFSEIVYGNYTRVIDFSETIDGDNIKAKLNNGQLMIVIPKVNEKSKQIIIE